MRWIRLIPDRVGHPGATNINGSPDALAAGLDRPVKPGECDSRRRSNASDEIALDAIRQGSTSSARRVRQQSDESEGNLAKRRNRRCKEEEQDQGERAGEVREPIGRSKMDSKELEKVQSRSREREVVYVGF